MAASESPVITMHDIASMIGVGYHYLQTIRGRAQAARRKAAEEGVAPDPDLMPDADFTIAGRPTWKRETIVDWAHRTGRLS